MQPIIYRVWREFEDGLRFAIFNFTNKSDALMWANELDEFKAIDRSINICDKDKTLIFENDIIEQDKSIGIVYFEDWCEVYVEEIKQNPTGIIFDDLVRDLYRLNRFKIIGNKYLNPELLRKTE